MAVDFTVHLIVFVKTVILLILNNIKTLILND